MPLIEVSNGELIDKLSILVIKRDRILEPTALANVMREHDLLSAVVDENLAVFDHTLTTDFYRLVLINQKLWDVEDRLRAKERDQQFDAEFIALARSVYHLNDDRAAIKRNINTKTRSTLVEEKLYTSYPSNVELL